MRHHNHEHVEKVMNDLVSLRNCFCGLFVCSLCVAQSLVCASSSALAIRCLLDI